jgi:energy-coupling factor transport system ATP-binding protein
MTGAKDGTEQALRLSGVEVFGSPESAENGARPILDGIELTLRPGEWLYLVGVNGSGKSTLARLLAGLHVDAAFGRMSRGFAGDAASPIVLQRPEAQLFGETPREEIGFALEWRTAEAPDRIRERIDGILEEAGLTELADRRWEELSGGQRQLAAAAAALAVPAPLVVFDEASSMLDDAARRKLLRRARKRHRQGTAIVWTTQRLEEIEPDARVVALEDGRIRYDGDGRTFFYGGGTGPSPCECCGLRLPYLASLAYEMKRSGKWSDPLPLSEAEWLAWAESGERLGDGGPEPSAVGRAVPFRVQLLQLGLSREDGETEAGAEGAFAPFAGDEGGTIRLKPGTLTLILGMNGAGKTVLLEKIAGLRDPEGMCVRYGGQPLWRKRRLFPGRRLRAELLPVYGMAAQSPEQALLERTVEREIEYSLRPYRRTGVLNRAGGKEAATAADKAVAADEADASNRTNALDAAGAADAVDAALSAVGWDRSWLGRDPFRMSGGERRRAALAALLATPAHWLLLDEPTAGLDREGHVQLGAHLKMLKREGRGIVLVSHDTDWALPLADLVLLLRPDGQLIRLRPEELLDCPKLLESAGLAAPVWLRLAGRIRRSAGLAPETLWDPERAAAEWDGGRGGVRPASAGKEAGGDRVNAVPDGGAPARSRVSGPFGTGEPAAERATNTRHSRTSAPRHRLSGFDPRAVWLSYALLSFGWFTLTTRAGIALGLIGSLILLAAFRIPIRRWRGWIAGYVVFGLLFAAVAAARPAWNAAPPLHWDPAVFAGVLTPFVRSLPALLLGLGLPLVMTPLALRQALGALIPRGAKAQEIGQRIVLAVTLTVRFVPVLLGEWERFRRVQLARGKEAGRTPAAMFRRLRGTAIPLLLSLFRLADDTALALESRGVRKGVRPARSASRSWQWRDAALIAGAVLLAAMLHFLDRCWTCGLPFFGL